MDYANKGGRRLPINLGLTALMAAAAGAFGSAQAQVDMDVTGQESGIESLDRLAEFGQQIIDFMAGQGGLVLLVLMVVGGAIFWAVFPKGSGLMAAGRAIFVLAVLPGIMQLLAFFGVIGGV